MKSVEYHSGYQNPLEKSFFSFFLQKKGILLTVLLNLIGGGIFAWIDKTKDLFSYQFILTSTELILIAFVCMAIFIVIISVFYSNNGKLSKLPWYLHQFAHYLRDRHSITEELARSQKNLSRLQREDYRHAYCDNVCNKIRDYFRILINDDTIECAIRLADRDSNNPDNSDVLYATSGRSNGFSPGRDETSEPISAKEGVPKKFFEKDYLGVYIYYNLKVAADEDHFKATKSERRYGDDVKTFMVAPINGWDSDEKSMIGLLFVTSKKSPFHKKYTESIKLFADLLGESIPKIIDLYYNSLKQNKNARRGKYDR